MELVEVYAASRARLISLAGAIDPAAAARTVAPTPLWDVTDVYRHLAGLAADVLADRLEGAGSPAWTAAQVEAFRGRALPEVCAAWAADAPRFDARLAAMGALGTRIAGDVWTHEQDVRLTIGLPGLRDDPAAAVLARANVALVTERWALVGGPPAEVVVDGHPYRLGVGEPELTLRTTAYEFVRSVVGRRSAAQLAAADWSGPNPERAFPALSRLDLPVADVAD
jgi:uncharacterized protein (TIGR03083 family)